MPFVKSESAQRRHHAIHHGLSSSCTPRVLVLAPSFPWPPHSGARIRLREMLRHLQGRYRVTLLAHGDPNKAVAAGDELNELCESAELIPIGLSSVARIARLTRGVLRRSPPIQSYHYVPRMARRIREITSHQHFEVLHVEFPFLAPYLSAISPRCRARRVLSTHNVDSLRFERELEISPWGGRRLVILADRLLFPHWERDAVRRFDSVVTVSDADRLWIERNAPGVPVFLAPNGVDVDHYRPIGPAAATPTVVFTGSMNYPPNQDAVIWFADNVVEQLRTKLGEIRFDVVGADPSPAVRALCRRPGVRVTGAVPDVRPYLADSIALVVPLRSGGGTRLKILEAMAMARPVVSTAIGAEGLKVTHGRDILIADDPERLAEEIATLARVPELGARLGAAARQLVVSEYDWRICLRGLDRAYEPAGGERGA